MVGHSPIPRFDSTFCGETIVSKTAQESGYLVELSGTAVGRGVQCAGSEETDCLAATVAVVVAHFLTAAKQIRHLRH